MKQPHWIKYGLLAAIALPGAQAYAQATPGSDSGWYVGGGIGRSQAQDLGSIDGTFAGYGIGSSSAVGDRATTWKLLTGYQFNRNFSVEGAYADLGKFDINSTLTAPGAGPGAGSWQAGNVWSLAGVGTLPLGERFSAFGKLGLAYSKATLNFAGPGAAISQNTTGTNPLYGLGVKYDIDKHTALRGEWERYSNIGDSSVTGKSDVDAWTVGLQYRF